MNLIFKNLSRFTALVLLVFLFACKNGNDMATQNEAQNETRNMATTRAILAAMDEGATDKFDAWCAADFQINNPFLPGPAPLDVFKGLMQGQKAGFPDVKHEVVQIFASGNLVCVRGVYSGTNTGPMQGNPATGNKVVLPFLFTDEYDEAGKLKVRHVQFDTGLFNTQLMAEK